MDLEQQIEARLNAVLPRHGTDYVNARNLFLELGPQAFPALTSKRESGDWKVALQADILIGWLTTPALFQKAIDLSQGKLPGDPGILGKFTAQQRSEAIAKLGRSTAPCLLELVLKIGTHDAEQRVSALAALTLIADPSAVIPIISLLGAEEPEVRMEAASFLAHSSDPRAIPPLLALLQDPSQPDLLRGTAAQALGTLGAKEAMPFLESLVTDERASLPLRDSAVYAMRALKAPHAARAFAKALPRATDLSFLVNLIGGLGDLGDRSALPLLEKLAKHPNDNVRWDAEEAKRPILERLRLITRNPASGPLVPWLCTRGLAWRRKQDPMLPRSPHWPAASLGPQPCSRVRRKGRNPFPPEEGTPALDLSQPGGAGTKEGCRAFRLQTPGPRASGFRLQVWLSCGAICGARLSSRSLVFFANWAKFWPRRDYDPSSPSPYP